MDFVQKVLTFNQIAGNNNQFDARKLGLYIGLIAEEFVELLESIPRTDDVQSGQLLEAIGTIEALANASKAGSYDHLIENIDRVEAVDAHIDIAVVALGAAVVTGADVEGACHNVADSNLSKFPIVDGQYTVLKNSAGKVIKPASYTPANIKQFLK